MFKKVKELLENKSISQEVANLLDTEIQTELKSLRDESASWRVKYKELETTFNEVSSSKTNLEEQLASLDEKIANAKDEGKKELVKELEKERKTKDELVSQLNSLEATTKNLKLENALNSALDGYEMIDKELITLSLKQSLDIKDDGVIFGDGKSLEDGVKGFFEAKPHLLKPQGNSGSGTDNNTNEGYAKDSFTQQLLNQRG